MAPQQVVIFDQECCNMNFVPQHGNINNQIIIKLYDNNQKEFGWNFNADMEDDVMGLCQYSDVFMQIAGCEMDKWYKRFAYIDPEPQIIIQEMSPEEVNSYIMNHRHEESLPNNSTNNPQNGCQRNNFYSANSNQIIMTFE